MRLAALGAGALLIPLLLGAATMSRATPTGDKSICRGQACLTRSDTGVTGDHNKLSFNNGVHAYGGYWTIEHVGTVHNGWPFKYPYFNGRWKGKEVVQIATRTYNHQYAAGTCPRLKVATCLETTSVDTHWVAVGQRGGLWRFASVNGTDHIYALARKRTTYFLEDIGAGRQAVIGPNGNVTQFMKIRNTG